MKPLYPWQRQVIERYPGRGVVKAVTGAGKSRVGYELAGRRGGRVLVTAASRTTLDEVWRPLMDDLPHVEYLTFQRIARLPDPRMVGHVDLLIVDDCHRATSEKYRRVFSIPHDNILCLSATPDEESLRLCGDLLCDVGYDQARVSPFVVTFHGVELTPAERDNYEELSKKIAALGKARTAKEKKMLDSVIRKRRDLVYRARNRVPYAVDLVRGEHARGRKILVVCQRIDQAEELSGHLQDIPHIVYHSRRMDDLSGYLSGEVRLCISVGMLQEGFNDPETDVGIVVSTTLSEDFNTQVIGRAIRYVPKKDADIHIILANGTTDMEVLDYAKNYEHFLVNIKRPMVAPEVIRVSDRELVEELREILHMKEEMGLHPGVRVELEGGGWGYVVGGLVVLGLCIGAMALIRR
ncbi:MAG: hypothetical protein PHU95_00695 [Candidatus Thermoplasmatota archaeon]|nr:hypothetical protein [Candidatus Thermoplasmatota archaeon]MDD5777955.1 hypothetical protein [Candidatus Thermoplasmatota archaeon]